MLKREREREHTDRQCNKDEVTKSIAQKWQKIKDNLDVILCVKKGRREILGRKLCSSWTLFVADTGIVVFSSGGWGVDRVGEREIVSWKGRDRYSLR